MYLAIQSQPPGSVTGSLRLTEQVPHAAGSVGVCPPACRIHLIIPRPCQCSLCSPDQGVAHLTSDFLLGSCPGKQHC